MNKRSGKAKGPPAPIVDSGGARPQTSIYLARPDGTVTPLLAADELPPRFVIAGVERSMTMPQAKDKPGFEVVLQSRHKAEGVYSVTLGDVEMKEAAAAEGGAVAVAGVGGGRGGAEDKDEWADDASEATDYFAHHIGGPQSKRGRRGKQPAAAAAATATASKGTVVVKAKTKEKGKELAKPSPAHVAVAEGQLVPSTHEQLSRVGAKIAAKIKEQSKGRSEPLPVGPFPPPPLGTVASLEAPGGSNATFKIASVGTMPPAQVYNPITKGVFGRKVFCSHWMRTGECDFSQQGCNYLHLMPDVETMGTLGMKAYPRWFREMSREYQEENAQDFDPAVLVEGSHRSGHPASQHGKGKRSKAAAAGHHPYVTAQYKPSSRTTASGRVSKVKRAAKNKIVLTLNQKESGSASSATVDGDRSPTSAHRDMILRDALGPQPAAENRYGTMNPVRPESSMSHHILAPRPLVPGQTTLAGGDGHFRPPSAMTNASIGGIFAANDRSYQMDYSHTLMDDDNSVIGTEMQTLGRHVENRAFHQLPQLAVDRRRHHRSHATSYNISNWPMGPHQMALHTAGLAHQQQQHSPSGFAFVPRPLHPLPPNPYEVRQEQTGAQHAQPASDVIDLTSAHSIGQQHGRTQSVAHGSNGNGNNVHRRMSGVPSSTSSDGISADLREAMEKVRREAAAVPLPGDVGNEHEIVLDFPEQDEGGNVDNSGDVEEQQIHIPKDFDDDGEAIN